jgi:CheY-like chemotaxis protein
MPDPDRARKKILVIDDDPVIAKSLSLTLTSAGYDVLTAQDGFEAIGLVRDEAPDLMLVDVCLAPSLPITWDGFQVAQWLRQVNRPIPIIVISGSFKPEYERQAIACGARAFFVKPLDNKLLLDLIASALSKNAGTPAFVKG